MPLAPVRRCAKTSRYALSVGAFTVKRSAGVRVCVPSVAEDERSRTIGVVGVAVSASLMLIPSGWTRTT
ncbi:MAG: hypothetical protein AUI11_09275 [Acidobacteria bacterium 13_2_20CM_2_66_4]|nr:MAG: hypothetical protein AUI11_09275 [Acidobacteria bacterium 13_2_20CM_2_66_4]